jgi:hypothetical protein
MIPQRVHTMRGPNNGTGVSSGQGSALRIVRWWWQSQHDTSSASNTATPSGPQTAASPSSVNDLARSLAAAAAIAG